MSMVTSGWSRRLAAWLAAAVLLVGCTAAPAGRPGTPAGDGRTGTHGTDAASGTGAASGTDSAIPAGTPRAGEALEVGYTPDVSFALETGIAEGRLVFIGVGGAIDGVVNPELRVAPDAVVQISLTSGDGAEHDIVLPDFGVQSDRVVGQGSSTVVVFRAVAEGSWVYFCSLPGHRQAGMEGRLIVGDVQQVADLGADVVRDPTDVGTPVGDRGPQTVRFDLTAREVVGRLAEGTSYHYWTFDGTVPGPLLRVRHGDTVEVSLTNEPGDTMIHSIDLHAVTGPGGGAAIMQVPPGETRAFSFEARHPGVYVYHCATPMVANHITNGMYGLIVVEPEGGLEPVDREFYVMQGELYTILPFGQHGEAGFSLEKLLDEDPEYYVFNGAVGALTDQHPMQVAVGDRVRMFFGVGGPNKTSSLHLIGEVFDRVYDQASITAAPLTDVQTTLVPPGGATMVEFAVEVPGNYILVDHALSRAERGLAGVLVAEGEDVPSVFRALER